MNERIRELVRQAGLDDPDFPIEDWDNVPLAKFAELIVAECAKVIFETPVEYMETDTMHRIRDRVKQHFGVNE